MSDPVRNHEECDDPDLLRVLLAERRDRSWWATPHPQRPVNPRVGRMNRRRLARAVGIPDDYSRSDR